MVKVSTSIKNDFFYFIFYLCVVEICPVLVAWSMLKRTLAG